MPEYNYRLVEQEDGSWIIFDPFGHLVQRCRSLAEASELARDLTIKHYEKFGKKEDDDAI